MITEEDYQKALEIVEAYKQQKVDKDLGDVLSKFPKTIDELNLSVRAKNALRRHTAYHLGHEKFYKREVYGQVNEMKDVILSISIEGLMKTRDCGERTKNEIEDVFLKQGFKIPSTAR